MMMRRTTVAAGLGLLALGGLAFPAHAQSTCTVNGVPASGADIRGTEGADTITCSLVLAGTVVDALGGVDTITVTGPVSGQVRAGNGADVLTVAATGRIGQGGSLDGQFDDDRFEVHGAVAGAVRGGQHNDDIQLHPTSDVEATGDVRGARGVDTITVDRGALVLGLVEGNQEGDTLVITTVAAGGRVRGDDGNDHITVRANQGEVDAGAGTDTCRIAGNPPLNCENVGPPPPLPAAVN
ncbi:MAG TPA: hypothetical protein VHJ17_26230 [Thermomonospora sp.]|nr:hypothetical protein [Thermomonospora sp.]